MKRLVASFTALLLTLVCAVGGAGSALAAPLPASYSGAAGGAVVAADVDVVNGVDLADVRLATAQSTMGTSLTPEVRSRSSNLAAAVEDLDLAVAFQQETASSVDPGGASTGELAAVQAAGVGAGALTTSNEARYAGDGSCVPGDLLADSRVRTAGAVVAPTGLIAVRTGDSATTGVTELVQTDGLNRSVRSTATGTISGVELLNETVVIGVEGTSTLTATATGQDGGAAVDYDPGTVTVTANGATVTIAPGESRTFAVVDDDDVEGSVTVTANEPEIGTVAEGVKAEATVAVVSAVVRLGSPDDLSATASIDLLPLNVAAEAPVGGIDCAPAPPVVATPADGSTTSDTTPPISGTGVEGAVITLTLDGKVIEDAAVVDDTGKWSYMPLSPLTEGEHVVSATQTVAGAESEKSNTSAFFVDLTPTIVVPADGSSTSDTTPPISGKAEPGSDVEVFVDGTSIGTDVADANGDYSVTPNRALDEGSHKAYAVAEGASRPSSTNTFSVDTAAPDAPRLITPEDNTVTDDTTPEFSGTAEPGAEVEIFVDDQSIGTTTADGDGRFSFTPTKRLSQDVHEAFVRATDSAGNTSPASEPILFLVYDEDSAPTLTTPPDGSTTRDSTPDFTGLAQPGARVEVFVDDESIGADIADEDGRYSVTPTQPLEDGFHYAYAEATGPDGTATSDDNGFDVDANAPEAPVITSPGDGDVVADGSLIAGTAEPGSRVTIFIDGEPVGDVVADENGRFRYFPDLGQLVGSHTISATSTDDADNVSEPSRPVRITGVAATAPVLNPPGDNGGNGPVQGPVPVVNNPGGDSLASTGGPSVLLSVLGGLLFFGGALVLRLARRRRLGLL